MPSIYRPTPRCDEGRRHALHRVLTDQGVRFVVIDPDLTIRADASKPLDTMHEGGLAELTVPRYARGFLSFLDVVTYAPTSTAPGAYTPWSPPPDAIELFKDCLRRLGAKLEESSVEPGVYHVSVDDEDDHDRVVAAICGVFHFYAAAVRSGVYRWPNPFEVPFEDRRARVIPGGSDGAFTITPRFRFRIPRGEASPLRTDSSDRVLGIVPALIATGVPTSIVMLIKLMIEGLARIAEQIRISLWDWWNSSQFGNSIDTTNKRSRGRRTKQQTITLELAAELVSFANGDRVALDKRGWTLDQWRSFLTDPTISMKERRKAAKAAPLFPAAHKGFYSRSGVVDAWYRPVMRAAGLPTRTHYIRHSGVNDFLTYVDARTDLTPDEKDAAKLSFAKAMGWKWPLAMLERYSLPARKAAQAIAAGEWIAHRREQHEAIKAGLGLPAPITKQTTTDRQLSRLTRFGIGRPVEMRMAA